MRAPPTLPSTRTSSTISSPMFSRPPTSAKPGLKLPPAFPMAPTSTPCVKIPSARVCSMPERKPASGFLSAMAHTGKLYSSTSPQLRSTISSFTVTIWLSPPTAAPSGRTTIRTRMGHTRRRRYAIGENPPDGAILYYYLKEEPKNPAKLELLDAQGKVISAFSSEEKKKEGPAEEWERDEEAEHIPAKAGLNQFTWNLRYESPKKIPAAIYDEGEPAGPLALPGAYQARLTVAGKSFTASFEVQMDPRVKTSAEDLRKQFDLMLKMRDRQDEMNKAILAIRDLRTQLQALEKRLGSNDQSKPVVSTSADLRKKISAIEEELIQVNSKASEDELNYPTKLNSKLGYLQNAVDSADAPPTEGELGVYSELDLQLESQLAKWREVLSKDVPALNDTMQKNSVPLIAPSAAKAN